MPQPSGNHRRSQQGRAKNACPEAELAGEVPHVFAGDEVINRPPDERTENEKEHQDGGYGDGANAPSASFLFLDDAQRSHHDATGAVGDFPVSAGTLSSEGGAQIAIVRSPGSSGHHFTPPEEEAPAD
jgi:hypothetical protein